MISLRPMSEGDREQVLSWRNLPEVRKWMYTDHVISREEHDVWFKYALSNASARYWIVVLRDEDVGVVSVSQIDTRNSRATFGFYLGNRSPLGLFLLDAIDYLVAEYVFGTLSIDRLWGEVLSTNTAVLSAQQRLGFRTEGVLRQHVSKGDGFHDVVVLGLLRGEWELIRAGVRERLEKRGLLMESSK